MTPRDYLSFSQLALFERSRDLYAQEYIYDRKKRPSRNMEYGKKLADGLEVEEFTGDPLLDLVMARLPKFDLMDKPIEAEMKDKKSVIKLLAKPDTAKSDYTAFKEYKTSTRPWTQKMADESGQVTFYAFVIWLKTGNIPKDIELISALTAYDSRGRLSVTGDIMRFPTKRTMVDIIKMASRARNAWKGIQKLCEEEIL